MGLSILQDLDVDEDIRSVNIQPPDLDIGPKTSMIQYFRQHPFSQRSCQSNAWNMTSDPNPQSIQLGILLSEASPLLYEM